MTTNPWPSCILTVLVLLSACKKDGQDTSSPTDSGDTVEMPEGPCAGGGWGTISSPLDAVHVRMDGSDEGTGHIDAPLLSLEAAHTLTSLSSGVKAIALGPGEWEVELELVEHASSDGQTDVGTSIEGCGPLETFLSAVSDEYPAIRVTGATGVRLAGFKVTGGFRSIWIWGGAQVSIEELIITDARRTGVVIAGATSVDMLNVKVVDIVPEVDGNGTQVGYGISMEEGTLCLSGVEVSGATTAGIIVNGGSLDMLDSRVSSTSANSAGLFGRGLQLQGFSVAIVQDSEFTNNADTAVFSLQSTQLELSTLNIEDTGAAQTPSGESTGDGIVVTGWSDEDSSYNPASFQSILTDNLIISSARAGIVVEGASANLSGNQVSDSGYSSGQVSIFAQNDALISGIDDVVLATEGGEVEPLEVNRSVLLLDELGLR